MPNHITNLVTGPEIVINELAKLNPSVTFEGIIPTTLPHPDANAISLTQLARLFIDALKSSESWRAEELALSAFVKDMDDEKFTNFLQCLENARKTGYLHWHDHNMARWGTKWNAYESWLKFNGNQSQACFQTAWSTPLPIFKALSLRFPDQMFTVFYADEDWGNNMAALRFFEGSHWTLTAQQYYGRLVNKEIPDPSIVAMSFCSNPHLPPFDVESLKQSDTYKEFESYKTVEEAEHDYGSFGIKLFNYIKGLK